ncbi:mucin-3A-like [Caretta caretta]|uniref:mucin-3A-like n=1 Tax=Caretta caretta TaxID=8467 RepID=UPI003F4B1600
MDGRGSLPVDCLNGGTYDGKKCICKSAFNGPQCEFAKDVIATNVSTFKAEVEVQVKVTNQNFSEELNNKSSTVYIKFEVQFKIQMDMVYKSMTGYKGIVILTLRQGSIVVDHTVIIEAPLSNNLDATLESITKQVVKELEVINTTTGNCKDTLCFTAPPNPVKNATMNFSAADICKQSVPQDFAQYYYPHITEKGTLSCLTRCSQDLPDFLNCNYGQCQLKSSGPQCTCANKDVFWYPGDRCQTRISKVGVGMAVPLVVLFIAGIVLATFLVRARSRGSKARLDSSVEQPEDYEEEVSISGGVIIKNEGASYNGSGSRGTFSCQLSAVDPAIKMHIRRPKLVSSP